MNFNFEYQADLIIKAEKETDEQIPITIIPNRPTSDRQNDTIHLGAFDKSCIDNFMSEGIIDFDHLSHRGKDALEKAKAHIGDPTAFYIDAKRKVPVCDAVLFKSNPFVRDSILPALRAKTKKIGASVGGSAMKASHKDPLNKSGGGKNIFRVRLKHIAICLKQKAIHPGTLVELKKSLNEDEKDIVVFNVFDDLCKSLESEEYLMKTLTAGSATNIADISGGQVLQSQSLEGSKKKKSVVKQIFPFFLENIVNQRIDPNYNSYKKYLKNKGLDDKISNELITLVATNGAKIINAIK